MIGFLGSIFGGGRKKGNAIGPGARFTTPAFLFDISRDPEGRLDAKVNRRLTRGQIAFENRFPGVLNDLADLRGQLNPGFGALTTAGVNAIENQRVRSIGDLRESLNRRRILGSSFANDAIARVNAEFADREAEFRARTLLQEVDANRQLLQQEFNFIQTELQRDLAESQFAAGTQLAITNVLTSVARTNAATAEQQGGFLSSLLQGGISAGAGALLGPTFSGAGEGLAGFLGFGGGAPLSLDISGPGSPLTIGDGIIP